MSWSNCWHRVSSVPRRARRRRRKKRRSKTLFLALGGIGDTVLSFATARQLRSLRPEGHLVALAMWPQSAELLEDLGVFDEVLHHHFQRGPWWKSLAMTWRLHLRRFDTSILAFPTNRFEYNVLQWLIHAKRRIGHEYLRGSNLFYLRWLLTDRVKQTSGTHNVLENLELLRLTGTETAVEPPDITLGPLGPEYRLYAERVLSGPRKPLLGIHAGSSAYKNLHAKRWPAERFAELCAYVLHEDGLAPVLFGTAEDREINEAIRARCPSARIMEAPSIRHTAALIQRCSAFVSNDSALAHLASALDVPTVMLVGPTDPLEVGPFTGNGVVVSAPIGCAPCFRVSRRPLTCGHPLRFACMKMIDVGRVLHEVRKLLRVPRGKPLAVERGERSSRPVTVRPDEAFPARATEGGRVDRRREIDRAEPVEAGDSAVLFADAGSREPGTKEMARGAELPAWCTWRDRGTRTKMDCLRAEYDALENEVGAS